MRYIALIPAIALPACSLMPSLGNDVEDMVEANAVKVAVQRSALQKDSDVQIDVKIRNKDK